MTWKPWPKDERYLVSDQGQVRGLKGHVLKPGRAGTNYRKVSTKPNPNQRVDYMVLETFVGPRPEGHEVLHANDDQSDNRLENLRWGTHVENCQDRTQNGKLHIEFKYDYERIRQMRRDGMSYLAIQEATGASRVTVWRALSSENIMEDSPK